MKGIIVDINKNDAVILADDGLFTKIKNENYSIGQILHIGESVTGLQLVRETGSTNRQPVLKSRPENPIRGKKNWAAAGAGRFRESLKTGSKLLTGAASMAAVMAIGTIGAFAYYTPTDYVSLDVNPSIEYSLNMFDRILNVNAANDDGEEILSNLDLNNKNIQVGIKETLDQLVAEGYLTDGPDDSVVIATSNDQQAEAERLAAELKQEVRTYLSSQKGVNAAVNSEAVDRETVKKAEQLGVTPGKLNLVEKLEASTSSAIDRDEWLKMPVKDINKTIKENRKAAKMKPHDPALMTYNPEGDGDQGWNWNQAEEQDWDQSKNQNKNPGKNQNQNGDQNTYGGWNQYWRAPEKTTGGSIDGIWNWNQNHKQNQNHKNQNQNQNKNQNKDQNQNQNQSKNQNNNWNQSGGEDRDDDDDQSGSRDEGTKDNK